MPSTRAAEPPDPLATLALGISRTLQRAPRAEEIERFQRYLDLILRWNRTRRLTAYRRPEEVVEKLFLDSLLFLKVLPKTASAILDYGAGAGIPSIPLKIVLPRIVLTLVEARKNRAVFLRLVTRELALQRVTTLHGRAEQVLDAFPLRGAFDCVVSRAVGPLEATIATALNFLKPGGTFVASGPPVCRKAPSLPHGFPGSWIEVPSGWNPLPRRFLLVQKED